MKRTLTRLSILCGASVWASLVVANPLDEPSITKDSYYWRLYGHCMSSQVSAEADIVKEYEGEQRRFMPLLLPKPMNDLLLRGGLLPVTSWSGFSEEFLKGLVSEDRDGIIYWPIWVLEDDQANPRRRLFINARQEVIAEAPVPKDYDSAWYVKERYPHLCDAVTTPAELEFLSRMEAIYDGKRLIMGYELIDEESLKMLLWQRSLEWTALLESERAEGGMTMLGEGGGVTELQFVEIAPSGTEGAMSVTVAYPEAFTGRISIVACDDLASLEWVLLATVNAPAEQNTITYVDEEAASSSSRFYHAYNADYDGDGDGIADGQEYFLDGTDPENPDDPPNVKGTVTYETFSGGQGGSIWVVAVTSPTSWSTAYSDVLDGPGDFHIVDLPPGSYYLKAFRDSNGNGSPGTYEAQGSFAGSPVTVNGQVTGVNIGLIDPDTDADGLPDWWEFQHFEDLGESSSGDVEPDGLSNLAEYQAGTDPNLEDTGYIPNNKNGQSWPATVPIPPPDIGAPTQEREYKFSFEGITSFRPNDGVARALSERIDNVLIGAVANRANWAAYAALDRFPPDPNGGIHNIPEPTAGNASYLRTEAFPTHTAYMDFYFDTDDLLCYNNIIEYRMRQRFDNTERWYNHIGGGLNQPDPAGLNDRIEFMSKVARQFNPSRPGWSEVTESRNGSFQILVTPAADIQDRIDAFQDGRWPADLKLFRDDSQASPYATKVGNPAWMLRSNLVAIGAVRETDVLKFRPELVVLSERRRQHLEVPGLQLGFAPGVPPEVFIISVDSAHVYQQDSLLEYMEDPTSVPLPQPVGSFVEVEVEFERNVSDQLDDLINADPPRPDHDDLVALLEAFLEDQQTIINLITAEFNQKPHDLTEFYTVKAALLYLQTHGYVLGSGVQHEGVGGIVGTGLAFDGNGYVAYVADQTSPAPTVTVDPESPFVLTEFQTRANVDAIQDEAGELEDWIEIQNVSDTVLSLNGWYLTDNAGNLTKWAFPNVSVPAGGFLIVFADNENPGDTVPPLHSNFAITGTGEYLALVKPDGTSIATRYATPAIPDFDYDVSYGVVRKGDEWVEGFFNASPGEPNQGIYVRRAMELGNADFTVSLWLKTTSAGVAILSKSDQDGTLGTGEKQLYLDGNGKVRYFGQGAGSIVGSTPVHNGSWHHIAVTFDASTGAAKVYVDGADDTDSGNSNFSAFADAAEANLFLGYDTSAQAASNMIGVLDEVAIWARTLSAAEVSALYAGGAPSSGLDTRTELPKGLLFHASMDVFLVPQAATKYQQAFDRLP